jgi:urea transport system permease protein
VVFNQQTTVGMKLRAVVQDRAATAFGIDADRIYTGTFAYGAGLAGLAGALVRLSGAYRLKWVRAVVDAFFVVVPASIVCSAPLLALSCSASSPESLPSGRMTQSQRRSC